MQGEQEKVEDERQRIKRIQSITDITGSEAHANIFELYMFLDNNKKGKNTCKLFFFACVGVVRW